MKHFTQIKIKTRIKKVKTTTTCASGFLILCPPSKISKNTTTNSVSRSALCVVLLKAWPDPNELLCNTNTNSEITQNWTYEIESSECQETSGSQITDISDNSN
ncbi:unnamed protein product [Brugia pahangi]|uniref:Fibronectin type-III domain-containing protein n=1 Tax=Brugia pahangi TaxID=6280 RepID=A0A0N4T7D3_BRUPA|nr:unnamed protein product [Brugia pahangi]